MVGGFRLDLKVDEALYRVPEILNDLQRNLDIAAARATRRTGQWLSSHSSREIARELRIRQSPVRHRYNLYTSAKGKEVKIWVGLEPIAVHYLGNPKETATGVSVGHRQYDDAFIANSRGGKQLVWIRKGRQRLPIKVVTEDWEGPAMNVLERWEKRAMAQFAEFFEEEARNALEKAR
jgi:hypothetical protein